MKLVFTVLYAHKGDASPVRLSVAEDLTAFNFFQRGTIREHIIFASRTTCQRTNVGQRQTITLKDVPFLCHVRVRNDGLTAVAIADKEYPPRVAFSLLDKVMEEFEKFTQNAAIQWQQHVEGTDIDFPQLNEIFTKYQDPKEADKIMKIQQNLDQVTDVMQKNIDELLKRGETLDTLMAKSDDLSGASRLFANTARKNNQCCKV